MRRTRHKSTVIAQKEPKIIREIDCIRFERCAHFRADSKQGNPLDGRAWFAAHAGGRAPPTLLLRNHSDVNTCLNYLTGF